MSTHYINSKYANELRKNLLATKGVEYTIDVWIDGAGEEEGTPLNPGIDEYFRVGNRFYWIRRYDPDTVSYGEWPSDEYIAKVKEDPTRYPVQFVEATVKIK